MIHNAQAALKVLRLRVSKSRNIEVWFTRLVKLEIAE